MTIPNGVPVHAGTWENGKPNYEFPKRLQQLAAPTVDIANSLSSLAKYQLPSPFQNASIEENIVNAILAQSKATSLDPRAPFQFREPAAHKTLSSSIAQAPNPFETLLSNGAQLDQLSNIASKILNFGGGEGLKGGGLLGAMTNALRAPHLPSPNTAFQNDFAFGNAKPQQTIMEKLITQAASAFDQSLKEKDDKERQFRMTKNREDSLKLLDKLPEEERKLLKAAITSGELDEDTIGPALKSLVKDDTKEDSKKEKESRLTEWIRENRPNNKRKQVSVSADKLPYYGKYCGSLAEQVID
ncbi:hypothetical protein DICVIV_13559 [Dictyocaulus viviparus]|uniref:Uncharacterized protein n=1 Tax=Dictyocaulus viviparus TaxID=29172 RepID=A0A0D8X7H2_DICVI|nr:hypothetical protein DICVIV_13559 [Dictyocaulus viviparus]